jgi:hypothetical protein
VLYLEAYRAALLLFGTTVFGVRFLSAAAGVLSIATAMALGRALLPRGGGALAGLAVAGMRWHLILSRWAWNAIVVVPLLDVAALLLIAGRRRRGMAAVAGAGVVAGLGAHVYLAAWIALVALTVFLLWPSAGTTRRWRLAAAAVFAGTFLLVASPLLLTGRGKTPYFRRAGEHNLLLEMRRQRSAMPLFSSAAGALAAPWFLPDPSPWNDLPGRTRLGWILGIPVAVALTRALLRRREEASGFLLAHAAAGFTATVVWGTEMQPNGYRVAYLTTVTGVSVAAGSLALLSLIPARFNRDSGAPGDFRRSGGARRLPALGADARGLGGVSGPRQPARARRTALETLRPGVGGSTSVERPREPQHGVLRRARALRPRRTAAGAGLRRLLSGPSRAAALSPGAAGSLTGSRRANRRESTGRKGDSLGGRDRRANSSRIQARCSSAVTRDVLCDNDSTGA